MHFGLQSGTSETTRKAVLGFFPSEFIAEAKEIIHAKIDNNIVGTIWRTLVHKHGLECRRVW